MSDTGESGDSYNAEISAMCEQGGAEKQGHRESPVVYDMKRQRWYCPRCRPIVGRTLL
jgi:hypothetical protein